MLVMLILLRSVKKANEGTLEQMYYCNEEGQKGGKWCMIDGLLVKCTPCTITNNK